MGFHWLNGANLTTDLDPTKPQVLVYEPDRKGKLHLVALEYVVFKADWDAAHPGTMPELFGEEFMDSGFPNRYDLPQFYALHVWLWKFNPAGLFKPFNRNVSCDGATGSVGASTVAARGVFADRVDDGRREGRLRVLDATGRLGLSNLPVSRPATDAGDVGTVRHGSCPRPFPAVHNPPVT